MQQKQVVLTRLYGADGDEIVMLPRARGISLGFEKGCGDGDRKNADRRHCVTEATQVAGEGLPCVVPRDDHTTAPVRKHLEPARVALRLTRWEEFRVLDGQDIVQEKDRLHVWAAIEPAEVPIHPQRKLAHIQIDCTNGYGALQAAAGKKPARAENIALAQGVRNRAACSDRVGGCFLIARTCRDFVVEERHQPLIGCVVLGSSRLAPMTADRIDDLARCSVVDSARTPRTKQRAATASRFRQEVLRIAEVDPVNAIRRRTTEPRCQAGDIEDDCGLPQGILASADDPRCR